MCSAVISPCLTTLASVASSPTAQFESISSSAFNLLWSNSYICTLTMGKTIALTLWTFVGKVMSPFTKGVKPVKQQRGISHTNPCGWGFTDAWDREAPREIGGRQFPPAQAQRQTQSSPYMRPPLQAKQPMEAGGCACPPGPLLSLS